MVNVPVQYPHTLSITTVSGSTQDVNGNWTDGTPQTSSFKCRAEFLRGGGFVKNTDGEDTNFNWLVWMPLTTTIIPSGSKVQILDSDNNLIIESAVVRFLKGQFSTRVWL